VWKNRQTDKHTNAAENTTHATTVGMGNSTYALQQTFMDVNSSLTLGTAQQCTK